MRRVATSRRLRNPITPEAFPRNTGGFGHTQRSGYAGISPFTLWRNILSVEGELGPL